MRYLGGKVRQAQRIRSCILERRTSQLYYLEPFLGGGSTFACIASDFAAAVAADTDESLIMLWEAVVNDGWVPPASLSKSEYELLRVGDPSPLQAWAKYACSYNGRPWGGYGPIAGNRNYLEESLRSIQRKASLIKNAEFKHCSFKDHSPTKDIIVYCDPPYENSTGYGVDFDHDEFWETMNAWVSGGVMVFVSEFDAPPGWSVCDSWDRSATVDAQKTKRRVEKLFVNETHF